MIAYTFDIKEFLVATLLENEVQIKPVWAADRLLKTKHSLFLYHRIWKILLLTVKYFHLCVFSHAFGLILLMDEIPGKI